MTKQLLWLALALPLCAADNPKVEMETTYGKLTIELYMDDAPNTVVNFLTLVDKGFYDGLTFHRIITQFMAQGGDPEGTGGGGPGYCLPAEFNARKHVRGTLSMARTFEPNTGGSQFFLCFNEVKHLDEQYTAFGQVVDGDDVLTKIEKEAASQSGQPRAEVKIVKAKTLSKPDKLPPLVTLKKDETPFLGIQGVDLGAQGRGVAITSLIPQGGCAQSGLHEGDLIEKIGGADVKTLQDYAKAIVAMKPGDKLTFTVRRGDESVDVPVTALRMP